MRADDVHVPHEQPGSSQRPPIDTPGPSRSRLRDDEDNDDDEEDDDDYNDPSYLQDELTASQLYDAPHPTQTQVCHCTYLQASVKNMTK
jgi:hypothetical protein